MYLQTAFFFYGEITELWKSTECCYEKGHNIMHHFPLMFKIMLIQAECSRLWELAQIWNISGHVKLLWQNSR